MGATLISAWLVASQTEQKRGWGFWIFIVSNILWIMWSLHDSAYALFVMQIGLLIFGGYRSERLEKGEDISNLTGLQLLTPRWWIILVLSIIGGIGNVILLYQTVF